MNSAVLTFADTLGSAVSTSVSPGCLEAQLIGPLLVRRGETVLGSGQLGGPKPRQILELLLLNLGTPMSKDRLIDVLWTGQAPSEALHTIESYVSVLRRHLQPGMGKIGPLRTVTGGYLLDRAMVNLDVDRFDSLVRAAECAEPNRGVALFEEALALASAPLLSDELVPPWAESERTRHATRVTHTRILAAELALAVDRPQLAIKWARQALTEDPLSEEAWTSLVLGLEKNGQPTEALRTFDHCRRVMDEDLGCRPGPNLRTIHARLLEATGDVPVSPVGPDPARTPIRIIIINRHRTFSELLAYALNREPDMLSVGTADSGESGIGLVRQLTPDVVLLDGRLRDSDGFSAARRIVDCAPCTRVLMLAGSPTPETRRQAAAAGVSALLPKDGSLATLLSAVRKHAAAVTRTQQKPPSAWRSRIAKA